MTLSEILAGQSYYNVEIPDKGHFKVHLIIHDGKIQSPQDVTEQRKEEK